MAYLNPYSSRFAIFGTAGVTPVVFTVPAGRVAVVKDVSAATAVAIAGAALFVRIAGDAFISWAGSPSALSSFHWSGMAVALAGETIEADPQAAGVQGVVSGYLLTAS